MSTPFCLKIRVSVVMKTIQIKLQKKDKEEILSGTTLKCAADKIKDREEPLYTSSMGHL